MRNAIRVIVAMMILVVAGNLLIVAIARVRDAAHRMQCSNNLRQIGLAIQNYKSSCDRFPSACRPNAELPLEKRLSWLVDINPYLEANDLYSRTSKDRSWEAEENRFLALHMIKSFQCTGYPDRPPESTLAPTHYIGISGLGADAAELALDDPRAGFFGYERKLRAQDFVGQAGSLVIVLETAHAEGTWIAAGRPTVRGLEEDAVPFLGPNGQFGGNHRKITNALFADASARKLSNAMDPEILKAIVTIKGSEGMEPMGDK